MTTVGLGLEEVIAGELKEIDASRGECFGGCVLSRGMRERE